MARLVVIVNYENTYIHYGIGLERRPEIVVVRFFGKGFFSAWIYILATTAEGRDSRRGCGSALCRKREGLRARDGEGCMRRPSSCLVHNSSRWGS